MGRMGVECMGLSVWGLGVGEGAKVLIVRE